MKDIRNFKLLLEGIMLHYSAEKVTTPMQELFNQEMNAIELIGDYYAIWLN